MPITVVGLGPGPADLLTVRAERTLREARRLVLRTRRHAMAAVIESWGIPFVTLDELYEEFPTFDQVYEAMVERLFDMSAHSPEGLTYAVPGHPLVAERSVALLLEAARGRGETVTVVPSTSSAEAVWVQLGIDPLESGVAYADAHSVAAARARPDALPPASGALWSRRRGYLVLQVDSALAAAELKAAVAERFGDHHPIALVRAVGSDRGDEAAVRWIPAYELDRGGEYDHETSVYVPPGIDRDGFRPGAGEGVEALVRVMAHLRSPAGCPWDRKQTMESLRRYVLEEAYEVCDAIERGDLDDLKEELGDLLLQVVFQAQLADEQGAFSMADVAETLREKLVRRHPHVFGDQRADDAAEVLRRWDAAKQREQERKDEAKGDDRDPSLMDGLNAAAPALTFAEATQRRAATVGFEWPDVSGAGRKAIEEAQELRQAWTEQDRDAVHRELGDLLFAIVNVARYMKVDGELALRDATLRFVRRFRRIEEMAESQGRTLAGMTLDEMDALWDAAKAAIAREAGGPRAVQNGPG